MRRRWDRAWPAFAALLAVLAWTLSRVAFVESHWDEDACVAIGWLLSKGWRLYADVFSHHMPLDYLPAWALAKVFGGRLPVFRGFMVALWAAVCLAVFAAWRRREPGRVPAGPFLFALFTSQWLTYWLGEMMLVEAYWGYAVVLLLLLLGSPLGFPEPEVSRGEASAAGALLGLLACASPTCWPLCALLAFWWAREPRWRARLLPAAAGLAAWTGLFLLWCARHADLSLWYADVIQFNSRVYVGFYGFRGAHPLLSFAARSAAESAAYLGSALRWNNFEQYFEAVLKCAVLAWIARRALAGRLLDALWWAAFVLALRARIEQPGSLPLHEGPYFLVATLLLARQLCEAWAAARRRPGPLPRLALACAALFFWLPTLIPTSLAAYSLKVYAGGDPAERQLARSIQACTRPDDRVAVFPYYPRLYVESGRLPAVPAVFYLPWQQAWPPQRAAVMEGLETRKPAAIAIRDATIWGVPWRDYGSEIASWTARGYLPVTRAAQAGDAPAARLWVRKDLASAFVSCARRL